MISIKTQEVQCSYIGTEIRQLNTCFFITKRSLTRKTYLKFYGDLVYKLKKLLVGLMSGALGLVDRVFAVHAGI